MICDLLYADYCALMTHTLADAKHLFSRFLNAATRFGLAVSLKKAEVALQSGDLPASTPLVIMAGEIALPAVDKFCYLGSIVSADVHYNDDISSRIAKASHSLGRLCRRLWDDHGIRFKTKFAVYKVAILTSLLWVCIWVLFCHHIWKL
jgi:hypothetical protein